MKKVILSAAFLFFVSWGSVSLAQTEVSAGAKAGGSLTNSSMSGLGTSNKMGFGGFAGGFVKIEWGEHFAIQPELLLKYNTSDWKSQGKTRTYKYWGVEIPVYAVGQLPFGNGRFFLGAGPYAAYGFSAKVGGENLYKKHDGMNKAAFSRFDFGVGAILGYEFGNGFMLNAGYQMGLFDNLKAEKSKATLKPRSLTLAVGYKF